MKWKRTLGQLLLLGVLILAFNIRLAESLYPPPTEWTRTYTYGIGDNHDEANSLIQTSDGGYAMLGFTRFYYGGWLYTEDFWLVKTDPAGNAEWNRTYGEPGTLYRESGESVVQTDDGGYALAGYTDDYSEPSDDDFWLVKTDSLGNMEWNKTYGGADDDRAYSVVQTSDGGYAMAGTTRSYDAERVNYVYLVKTDSTGNMEWNKTYGGASFDMAYCVIQTSDEGYVMAGSTLSYGAGYFDVWLIKTDSAGSMQWNQTYGGADSDRAYSVVQASDGGYALAGVTDSFGAGDDDSWLVKTDSAGKMMWNQTYGGIQPDIAYSMIQTSDGGYALVGWTASFGAGGCDSWLVKTDSTGNVEWNQTYGDPLADCGYAVVQTVGGGYAMAGFSNYYINSSYAVIDFCLVKTCSGGDVNGDGVIDIFDLSIVGLAYGRSEGEPGYNPDADLNADGRVEAKDLAIVCINYGTGY